MKTTERNNEGSVTVRDADRLIATMTIHYTTTRIGIGTMTTRQYCDDLLHANLILVIFIIIVVLLSSLTRVLVLIHRRLSGTLAHGRVVNVYCCLHRPEKSPTRQNNHISYNVTHLSEFKKDGQPVNACRSKLNS
jgi:hypothetical protein